jgi:hypothetical protein
MLKAQKPQRQSLVPDPGTNRLKKLRHGRLVISRHAFPNLPGLSIPPMTDTPSLSRKRCSEAVFPLIPEPFPANSCWKLDPSNQDPTVDRRPLPRRETTAITDRLVKRDAILGVLALKSNRGQPDSNGEGEKLEPIPRTNAKKVLRC